MIVIRNNSTNNNNNNNNKNNNNSMMKMMMISIMMLLLPSSTLSSSFLTLSKSAAVVVGSVRSVGAVGAVGAVVGVSEAEVVIVQQEQQQQQEQEQQQPQQQQQQQHEDRLLQQQQQQHADRLLQWEYVAPDADCGPYMYAYTYESTGLTRCLCKAGFRGYNCTFCESTEACDSIVPALEDTLLPNERITSSVCVTEPSYQTFHDLKTYDCEVDPSLQLLLSGLEAHANCDTRAGTCVVALNLLGREPVIDPFYIKCVSNGCKFIDNESSVRCDQIECKCHEEYCSDLARTMLKQLQPNTPVLLDISEQGYMDVALPGSPLPIKAQCEIAACAYNKVITVPVQDTTSTNNNGDASNNNNNNNNNNATTEIASLGNVGNFEESNSDAMTKDKEPLVGMETVSGLLLIVIYVLSLLLIGVSCSSNYIYQNNNTSNSSSSHEHQQQRKNQDGKDDDDNNKVAVPILETNSNNISSSDEKSNNHNNPYNITSFEWDNISCRVDTENKKQDLSTGQNDNNHNVDNHTNTNKGHKNILHRVSGKVHSGSVMGILGPSGSGKSSLINALYGLNSNNNNVVTGTVLIDGKRYRSRDIKNICSYVHQDDCLFPTLTVRECIEYSALLRLPKTLSLEQKLQKVQMVIEELHLESVANNRIGASYSSSSSGGGGSLFRGLLASNAADGKTNNDGNNNNASSDAGAGSRVSGGERKRVSIGMELVTSPQILFLDEPTSGLDSYTSYSILKTLKELAQGSNYDNNNNNNNHNNEFGNNAGGRIVILSIHQPNAKVFNMLDQVLLLYKGKTMYNGLTTEAAHNMHLYSGIGCPENENVADYMLDTISEKNSRETFIQGKFEMSEKELIQMINEDDITKLATATDKDDKEKQADQLLLSSKDDFNTEKTSMFFTEVPILLQRTARNIARDKSLFIMHMTISLILGICGGYVFYNVEDNLAGFQNRVGAFYFVLTFFGFSSFSSMDAFINERRIFVKETGAKYYSVTSYFIARTSLDIVVLRIIPITIFACFFYWIMGLQPLLGNFIIFLASVLTFNVAAGSLSVCIGTFSSSVGTASLISTVIFLIMLLFGGFLVNLSTLSPVVANMKYLSIFNYAFEILITNELHDTVLSFDAPGYPTIPVYGEVFLESLNVFYDNQMVDLLALCIVTVLLNIITYILLRLRVP